MLGKVGISVPFAETLTLSSMWVVFLLAVRKSPLERRSAQYRKRYAAIGGECRHKAASAHMSPLKRRSAQFIACAIKCRHRAASAQADYSRSGFV